MAKTRPPYPAEFRQQMIELVQAGRTPAELVRISPKLDQPFRTDLITRASLS